MLVGAGLPQLPGLSGDAKSYAERLFEFPHLGPLADADARDVLRIPVAEQNVAFADDALELILERTHGYPYFLQEWGYEAWNQAPRSPVDLDTVERAAPRVRERLDESFFRVRIDRPTPAEKNYLYAMAQLGPAPTARATSPTNSVCRSKQSRPVSALIRKGMIYSPAHGDTAFTVPMFDEFLRRTRQTAHNIIRGEMLSG